MQKNRRTTTKAERSPAAKYVLWGLFFALLIACYEVAVKYAEPRLLPIQHIRLEVSCERTSEQEIKKQTAGYVKGFFSTDVMKLKEKLLSIPFIDEVNVKRIWPDTLLITLVEQKFVALWDNTGAVTRKGIVVKGVNVDKDMPRFMGPEGQSVMMLEQYHEMSNILKPLNLTIKELNLNSRRSWQVVLSNNVKVIIGRNDIDNKLLNLATVFPKLKKRHGNTIDSVDLRYPNGICVHVK